MPAKRSSTSCPSSTTWKLSSATTVRHDPARIWHWPRAKAYNHYQLPVQDAAYLDSLHTVSFLVIRQDSILFENYRDGWNDTLTSNLYSATKTIVGLLTGIALDEGKIHSLDDPVSRYIPTYTKGRQADVTLRHLLTMSGGMAWDEAYSSLFSVTTHGYYGDDLHELVTGLDVVDEPRRAIRLPQRRNATPGLCARSRQGSDIEQICRRETLETDASRA